MEIILHWAGFCKFGEGTTSKNGVIARFVENHFHLVLVVWLVHDVVMQSFCDLIL